MQLKRLSDDWVFNGHFTEYVPPKPRMKVNEIAVIRGASRYQSLGFSGTAIKFTLRFLDSVNAHDFISKIDTVYEFTDEVGKRYQGVFKDDPEIKKIGEKGMYEVSVILQSMDNPGVGR